MTAVPPLDPVTLEVVVEGLIAIVREMRVTVKRTAYSFSIWEMEDFSCGLFDPTPRMVVQSDDHPGHVIPLPWSVACGLKDWGQELGPGDLIMLNDPYRGGTHLNDVTMLWPVFLDDELPGRHADPADQGDRAGEGESLGARADVRQYAAAGPAAGRLLRRGRRL